MILESPSFEFSKIRKTREESRSYCEMKLDKLLKHSVVIESLAAVSFLWKKWSDNISDVEDYLSLNPGLPSYTFYHLVDVTCLL